MSSEQSRKLLIKRSQQWSIAVLGLVLAVIPCCSPTRESSSSSAVEAVPLSEIRFPKEVFRVTFGLKDTKPEDWSGHLEPRDGQQLTVVPEHFRAGVYRHGFGDHHLDRNRGSRTPPNDRLTGPLSWICSTTKGLDPLHGSSQNSASQPVCQRGGESSWDLLSMLKRRGGRCISFLPTCRSSERFTF